jgi:UDP-2,3-diacylglucosamine pyrophosphatase LpxH
MPENQSLLQQLEQMLHWKKSKKFYADKLNITENEVDELLKGLRGSEEIQNDAEISNYIGELEDHVVRFLEDIQKGTGEVVFNSKDEIKSLDELIEKCNIDTEKWEITKYVQNYWGNGETPHWQVKAWLGKKKDEQVFQDSFISFLENYQPISPEVMAPKYAEGKKDACLIINKQDSHLNKLDIGGENDIDHRFGDFIQRVEIILNQASLSNNLTDIKYIIGSDEFNSEFTNATTKGTPQQNILSYHDSFQAICDHEVSVINLLLQKGENVDVIFVAGNHDEYVGWHLASWLQTYFRSEERVFFDISPRYRKYVSYGTSALMFNHGDALKPAKLAGLFPMEFKTEWSEHDNFYIFTGDKHHEMSLDFNGIKFYQLPAFSTAKSSWDDKNGYTVTKGEVTGFLIDLQDGITNIFKQYL